MTRSRKNPSASGIRTRDLPLSRRTPHPLGQRGGFRGGLSSIGVEPFSPTHTLSGKTGIDKHRDEPSNTPQITIYSAYLSQFCNKDVKLRESRALKANKSFVKTKHFNFFSAFFLSLFQPVSFLRPVCCCCYCCCCCCCFCCCCCCCCFFIFCRCCCCCLWGYFSEILFHFFGSSKCKLPQPSLSMTLEILCAV